MIIVIQLGIYRYLAQLNNANNLRYYYQIKAIISIELLCRRIVVDD